LTAAVTLSHVGPLPGNGSQAFPGISFLWILLTGVLKISPTEKGGSPMRNRLRLLVLIAVVLSVLIGASTVFAKERVVQLLLPNCE